jgi:uncharacterized membrane protein
MALANRTWTEYEVEQFIGNLLRGGVLLAAVVVLLGASLYLTRHGAALPLYGSFRGEPEELRHIPGILADAAALRGRGVIQLGLLLLIATPVARVVCAMGAFALQRDWLYVGVTVIVLSVLVYSLLGGHP